MFIVQHEAFWETLETTYNYSNASKNIETDPKQKKSLNQDGSWISAPQSLSFNSFSKRYEPLDHY